MDYTNGIVGQKRHISYQSLAEEMYVEPHQGIEKTETGYPSKSKLQRALKALQKIGLIEQIKHRRYLIFRCILAKQDFQASKKADTKSIPKIRGHIDTTYSQENIDITGLTLDFDFQADTPKTPFANQKADTPPVYPVKAKEKESLRDSKKKSFPQGFCVTANHIQLAKENQWPNPHTEFDAFKDYHLSKGTKFVDWDRAFYTWLRNAKRFGAQTKERSNGYTKSNGFNRAIENIINSPTRRKLP